MLLRGEAEDRYDVPAALALLRSSSAPFPHAFFSVSGLLLVRILMDHSIFIIIVPLVFRLHPALDSVAVRMASVHELRSCPPRERGDRQSRSRKGKSDARKPSCATQALALNEWPICLISLCWRRRFTRFWSRTYVGLLGRMQMGAKEESETDLH